DNGENHLVKSKNGERVPDISFRLCPRLNGEKVPDTEFLQTHKCHEDNFLDTESFARLRESREVKNGENLPIYEESLLGTVFSRTHCSSSSPMLQC
ncbi:hypothetical protein A2U01_0058064, partial [Trifolium medium]|nr:hypothetical protein [Trifolium medium]